MGIRQTESAATLLERQKQAVVNGPVLLDVRQVAAMLGCSVRHCYRLVDCGKMPAPVYLGALVKWRRA